MTFDLTMAEALLAVARDPATTPTILLASLRRMVGGSRVLTEDQVRVVRNDARPANVIAVAFGVSQSTVSNVLPGVSYTDVSGPPIRARERGWPVRTSDGKFRKVTEAAAHHHVMTAAMYGWIRQKVAQYERET